MKKFRKPIIICAVSAGIAAVAFFGIRQTSGPSELVAFRTETVAKGSVVNSISASGTMEPEELINVGAQVTGKIMGFGKDLDGKNVDYGSRIQAGKLLAQIDDVLYDAALREAKATKMQAEASILSSEADIKQAKARMALADRNWKRACELYPKGAMAKSEYDNAEASYITAQADIASSQANLEQAKAKLAIAEAALIKAQRNMDYCVISSPVDGIIIDRRVSVGQTVVSNMSASSIFLIAKDLKRMQVWVSVNEADIGEIKTGMPVTFTVDTFRDQEFHGVVHKIRLNATMSQNVVTYIVEVSTDNTDGKLLPYLTANVRFIRARKDNVLCVSNAALRFIPPEEQIDPAFRDWEPAEEKSVVWKENARHFLVPVELVTGLNNGVTAEVLSGDLKEGDVIVFGVQNAAEAAASAGNPGSGSPFLPKMPPHKGRGSAARRAAGK